MNTLKSLAQKAKNRLKSVGLNAAETSLVAGTEVIKKCAVSYRVASNDKELEDDKLYPKVKAILERDKDNPFPLKELIDTKVYSKLTSVEKEKYILNLSAKYNLLREKILLEEKNL